MSVDTDDLDRFERERPKPPARLYKYVAPERIDVLENALVRFTPPLNTNDIFEVRQTFDLIMGPKMQALFEEMSEETNFEESLSSALRDEPALSFLTNEDVKNLYALGTGGRDAEVDVKAMLSAVIQALPEYVNAPNQVESMLERFGSQQLLLSLSEKPDSSPMWAHYAANSTGFVIAFDTASPFFKRGENLENQGLHKVRYFDGRVPEIMDDPYAALVSKQADWAYEQEWRLYVKPDQVSEVRQTEGGEIHLVPFPRQAVSRVILGPRASNTLEGHLRKVLDDAYPSVPLMRLKPDRATAKLIEEPA